MILIDCPRCRRQVPARARSCPGCGKALERREVNWLRKHLLTDAVFLLSGASFLLWMLWLFLRDFFP